MNNTEEEFEDKEEAIDFLLDELSNRKQKEEWAQSLPGNPNNKAKVITLRKKIFAFSAVAASVALVCFLVLGGNDQIPEYQRYSSNMINQIELEYGQATRGSGAETDKGNKELRLAKQNNDHKKVLEFYISGGFNMTNEDKYNYSVLLAKQVKPENQLILDLTKELIDSESEYKADALLISATTNIKLNRIKEAISDLKQAKSYKYKTKEINKLLELLTTPK